MVIATAEQSRALLLAEQSRADERSRAEQTSRADEMSRRELTDEYGTNAGADGTPDSGRRGRFGGKGRPCGRSRGCTARAPNSAPPHSGGVATHPRGRERERKIEGGRERERERETEREIVLIRGGLIWIFNGIGGSRIKY